MLLGHPTSLYWVDRPFAVVWPNFSWLPNGGTPFVRLAAHCLESRPRTEGADFEICQTFAASPAEPGELPCWFSQPASVWCRLARGPISGVGPVAVRCPRVCQTTVR
jgi:hypothetical protein